jgi:predicted  nucleic acid-binding Zn-ribbon protein
MAQSPCDSLAAKNEHIRQELIRQRLEMDHMIKQIDAGNYDLAKARKEAEVLRNIMKGYITTIDSLQQSNTILSRELEELRRAAK